MPTLSLKIPLCVAVKVEAPNAPGELRPTENNARSCRKSLCCGPSAPLVLCTLDTDYQEGTLLVGIKIQ
jgi:hypothetical protein